MTSDAKIGLLLGLIFIFVIAFIINGLPRFQAVANNNELTTTMVSAQNGTLGIGRNERQIQESFDWPAAPDTQPHTTVQMPVEQKEDIRFTMKLPPEPPPVVHEPFVIEPSVIEPVVDQVAREVELSPLLPAEPPVSTPPRREKAKSRKSEPPKPDAPREYVVAEGDTLGAIAKKLYGPEEGNKVATITRIFEANRQILKSPDDISIGQKLTIPSLGNSGPNAEKSESESSLPGELFEKAIAIGKNLLKSDGPSESTNPTKPAPPSAATTYVVQDGDVLSRIAARQLGDSSRYLEIAKLNSLKDPDNLTVGMQLKMPAR